MRLLADGKKYGLLAVLISMGLASIAGAVDLTAVTVFACDDQGVVNTAGRWNTGPIDGAWDVFFYSGDVQTKNPDRIKWLNHTDDHTIRISLTPGTHTFTFQFDTPADFDNFGMNLFFDGRYDKPGISVRAKVDAAGPPYPKFIANGANPTMGWPITDIPGASTLVFQDIENHFWGYETRDGSLSVTMKSFHISRPAVEGNPDLVGQHEIKPDNQADYVGQFTVEVEKTNAQPPDYLLWLATAAEMDIDGKNQPAQWKQKFDWERVPPPFSFRYGDQSSTEILKEWQQKLTRQKIDENRIKNTLLYTDPRTGLQVRWEGILYRDFDTVEWTLYFKNNGSADTPILSDILPLDSAVEKNGADQFILHHAVGSPCQQIDYQPLETLLTPDMTKRIAAAGGRPTNSDMSYFNLECSGQKEGVIIVVGWPGQWASEFKHTKENNLQIQAGQELTHFKLLPGEEVRTPMIVLQFWRGGDWIDAQNRWRRWMMAYNMPRVDGKLPKPQLTPDSSVEYGEMVNANEENQKMFIDRYFEENIIPDYWWMDAGWYVNDWGWPNTGTWEVDTKRFPHGLRAVTDFAHAKGLKTIVWFEPERVTANTWLTNNHPDWILGGAGGGLLNLGNPQAWDWLVNHVDNLLTEQGIDLYRQDFNMDPLSFWRNNDTEDRQGITEIKHVTGYLAYWDELQKRHPGLLIDSCASGGRRNDLETMRRSVPLWRSDYWNEPIGTQCITYGISLWLPYHGTGTIQVDPYVFRSNMAPSFTLCWDMRDRNLDYDLLRKLISQWRQLSPCYYGDFYPLTPHSTAEDVWLAWQFNRPDAGEGVVQAFRRPECDAYGYQFRLRGLQAEVVYELTNFDSPDKVALTGRELMEAGMKMAIEDRPGAAVIHYQRQK